MTCKTFIEKNTNKDLIFGSFTSNISVMSFIVLGSVLAGIGLMFNLSSVIIGSMLISPLSVPILKYNTYFFNEKYESFGYNLLFLFYLCAISISVGIILDITNKHLKIQRKKTKEMEDRARSSLHLLRVESIIAFIAGIIGTIASLNNDAVTIAGTGIVVAFLPPLVNCGLYLGSFIYNKFFTDYEILNDSFGQYNIGFGLVESSDDLVGAITSLGVAVINLLFYSVGSYLALYFICKNK